mgnify:CR=1 FL=1
MAILHDAGGLSDRSVGIRLSVFYAALFLSAGLYLPYWSWVARRKRISWKKKRPPVM